MRVVVNSRRLVQWMWTGAGLLALLHVLVVVILRPGLPVTRLFDLGSEQNLPTWFSSLIWGLAAASAWQCARHEDGAQRGLWAAVAAVLLLLSIDEVATIHERASRIIDTELPASLRHWIEAEFWATSWPVVLGPVVLGIVCWMFMAFRRLLRGSRNAMLLVGAGLACAVFGGMILEATTNLLNHTTLESVWQVEKFLEECLEMTGGILVTTGILEHEGLLSEAGESARLAATATPFLTGTFAVGETTES